MDDHRSTRAEVEPGPHISAPDAEPATARTRWQALTNLRRARLLNGTHPQIAATLQTAAVKTLGDEAVAALAALSDEQLDALIHYLSSAEERRAAAAKTEAEGRIRRWQVKEVGRCMARGSTVSVQRRTALRRTTVRRHRRAARRLQKASGDDSGPSDPPGPAARLGAFILPLKLAALTAFVAITSVAAGVAVAAILAQLAPSWVRP